MLLNIELILRPSQGFVKYLNKSSKCNVQSPLLAIHDQSGSNPAGGIDVLLLRVLCVVRSRSLRWADHASEESYQVWCLSVTVKT